MPVKEISKQFQKRIRQAPACRFDQSHLHVLPIPFPRFRGQTKIADRLELCAPVTLEFDQAFVREFRPPKVKPAQTFALGLLDSLPEQVDHASELVKTSIGTAILIH